MPVMDAWYDLSAKVIKPVNCRNEIQCLRMLASIMKVALAQYPTTMEVRHVLVHVYIYKLRVYVYMGMYTCMLRVEVSTCLCVYVYRLYIHMCVCKLRSV